MVFLLWVAGSISLIVGAVIGTLAIMTAVEGGSVGILFAGLFAPKVTGPIVTGLFLLAAGEILDHLQAIRHRLSDQSADDEYTEEYNTQVTPRRVSRHRWRLPR